MYLVGNADEWWGYYWKAFVTGKDKNRIIISHRQLLLKITACSLSHKLGKTMELLSGNRKDQCEKTQLLLCARFLHVKIPSPSHPLFLPLQRRAAWGVQRAHAHAAAPSAAQSRGLMVSVGCSCQRVGCRASAKGTSGFRQSLGWAMHKPPPTSPHYAEVMCTSRFVTAVSALQTVKYR